MKCVNPFVNSVGAFGCGQCMACRLARQRVWLHRILLEAKQHEFSAFVTLTYAERDCPGELRPGDVQRFFKRLRRRIEPRKVRYFVSGEYGDRFQRPHYHAAIFNYPPCFGGPIRDGECECPACLGVRETWGFGHVFVGRLEPNAARYIAKYTLKKMTSPSDLRLAGRYPEFMRCSNRPGIGAGAMLAVASVLQRYPTKPLPSALLWSGKPQPLGRYLRRKVAELIHREVEPYVDHVLPVVRAFAFSRARSISSVYQEVNGPFERQLLSRYEAAQLRLSPQSPLFTARQTEEER